MEKSPSEIQDTRKSPISGTFKVIERCTYFLFLGVMLGISFVEKEAVNLVGLEEYTKTTGILMQSWPKFLAESHYLENVNSELLRTYQLAQVIFLPLSLAMTVVLYFFLVRRVELTTSKSFVWSVAGIPYVAVFAFLFTHLVFFNVMEFDQGFIASRAYGTQLLLFWLPLTYVILISIYLRLLLLLTLLAQRKRNYGDNSL